MTLVFTIYLVQASILAKVLKQQRFQFTFVWSQNLKVLCLVDTPSMKKKKFRTGFSLEIESPLVGPPDEYLFGSNATTGRLKAIGSPRNKFTKLFKCYNKWNVIEHSTAYCYKTTLTLLCILLQDNTNTTLQQQCWWRLAQWLIPNLNNVKLVSNKMKPSK